MSTTVQQKHTDGWAVEAAMHTGNSKQRGGVMDSTMLTPTQVSALCDGRPKPNYTLRRIKTLLAIIACTASATLLFTWRTADSQAATILAGVIYLLAGLWLIVRFAPRE